MEHKKDINEKTLTIP